MSTSDQPSRRNVHTREQIERVMAATDSELFNPQHGSTEIMRALPAVSSADPMTRADLEGLLERLDSMTGPDHSFDEAVADALSLDKYFGQLADAPTGVGCMMYKRQDGVWQSALRVSSSADANLATAERVLPAWSIRLGLSEGYHHPCVVMGRSHPTNATVAVEHRTAPLAMIKAILTALLTQQEARDA